MALILNQTLTAVAPNITSSFGASGGTAPYTYLVRPGGAGGTIDSSSGLYTAPPSIITNPQTQFDTIQVTDNIGLRTTAQILVGSPLLLFCDILQTELGLPNNRVYIYNQKIMQPTDVGLYIAVGILQNKVFGSSNSVASNGIDSIQSTNVVSTLSVNIISRDTSALDQKEAVILALNSTYSESQQEANSFAIGRIPPGGQFINLSEIDGAAIPYRFNISVNIQYFYKKTIPVPYFSDFPIFETTINS